MFSDGSWSGYNPVQSGIPRQQRQSVHNWLRGAADCGEKCSLAGALGTGAACQGASRFPRSDCRSWRGAGVATSKYAPRRISWRFGRRRLIARVREHGCVGISIGDRNVWSGCPGSPGVRSSSGRHGDGRTEVHGRAWENGFYRGNFRGVRILCCRADERSRDGVLHARSGSAARAVEFLEQCISSHLSNVSSPPGRRQVCGMQQSHSELE